GVSRELRRLARPAGTFDVRRYFRGTADLGFYNVGTKQVRGLAKAIYRAHHREWGVDDAMTLADRLIEDRFLEMKAVAIELVALYRRAFTPRLLPAWKRWLAQGYSSNWATTDAISGYLIGPLVVAHPALAPRVASWAHVGNLWLRRASAISLIPSVRQGRSLDTAYSVARRLHGDREDLIRKAVGWLLREAGKADMARLEYYLRATGPSIPRTTLRYAIERMPRAKRRAVLAATKAPRPKPASHRARATRGTEPRGAGRRET